jgi:hypothetical protein
VLAVLAAALVLAATAYGAMRTYAGRTSQHQRISFQVSHGAVRRLVYDILDTCPGGGLVRNHDFDFPAIRISHGRFGGTFVDDGVARAVVTGHVAGDAVSGTLTDRVRDRRSGGFCHGRATFGVRPGTRRRRPHRRERSHDRGPGARVRGASAAARIALRERRYYDAG